MYRILGLWGELLHWVTQQVELLHDTNFILNEAQLKIQEWS